MKIKIPEKLNILAEACPFPLYLVGGFVRDGLAGLNSDVKDYDICAPAAGEEFSKIASSLGADIKSVYANTGTVKLSFGGEYEFASFRSDEYVRGVHTPVNVFFTDDISLDARRRDFKCNAVYYDIRGGKFVDPLGGIGDIEKRRVSTVADADKVFGEDGLRLMRLARQSAQTGFTPTAECIEGARKNCALIDDIAPERIYAELNSVLKADLKYGIDKAQYAGLKILDEICVLERILPELTCGRGMVQNPTYHKYDVLEHSLRAAAYADADIRLAALLHDVGKPCTFIAAGNFYGHEKESARIAGDICARLKVSAKLTSEVQRLCATHMYDLRCDARESKIRRFFIKNYDILDKILKIKQADYSACRDDTDEAPCVTKWKKIYENMLFEGAPFTLKQLAVRGGELISAGIAPASVGEILGELLLECAQNANLNKKDVLLAHAVRMYENRSANISSPKG